MSCNIRNIKNIIYNNLKKKSLHTNPNSIQYIIYSDNVLNQLYNQ